MSFSQRLLMAAIAAILLSPVFSAVVLAAESVGSP